MTLKESSSAPAAAPGSHAAMRRHQALGATCGAPPEGQAKGTTSSGDELTIEDMGKWRGPPRRRVGSVRPIAAIDPPTPPVPRALLAQQHPPSEAEWNMKEHGEPVSDGDGDPAP